MLTKDRRDLILKKLSDSSKPLSASSLAEDYGVSRQIIVGDIAILRASNHDIISTNRGYILNEDKTHKQVSRVIKVKHNENETADELNVIVDAGAKVLNVYVKHEYYGEIKVDLNISNRREVDLFINDLNKANNSLLSKLTNYEHYHTVVAESEDTLDYVEKQLNKQGYLMGE